jgi:hypothetical protein
MQYSDYICIASAARTKRALSEKKMEERSRLLMRKIFLEPNNVALACLQPRVGSHLFSLKRRNY